MNYSNKYTNLVKDGADNSMRQCTVDADCQTTQTPTSTCDVAKKVCK